MRKLLALFSIIAGIVLIAISIKPRPVEIELRRKSYVAWEATLLGS